VPVQVAKADTDVSNDKIIFKATSAGNTVNQASIRFIDGSNYIPEGEEYDVNYTFVTWFSDGTDIYGLIYGRSQDDWFDLYIYKSSGNSGDFGTYAKEKSTYDQLVNYYELKIDEYGFFNDDPLVGCSIDFTKNFPLDDIKFIAYQYEYGYLNNADSEMYYTGNGKLEKLQSGLDLRDEYGGYDMDANALQFHTNMKNYTGTSAPVATPAPAAPIKLAIDSKTYYVGGEERQSDVAPFLENGHTLVPVRLISEVLGAKVDWNGNSQTVTIALNGKTIEIVIGQPLPNNLGTAILRDSRTFVPIEYIAEAFGSEVNWDQETRTITIN
jgi:hypothetical protein